MSKIERTSAPTKAAESNASFCVPEWRKIGYDDTYEDAQLLHNCMTKRLKREEDPDYSPDSQADTGGDSPRATNGQGQYFQKPIFQCPECVRSYKSPVRMANHYRDKHPDKDMRGPYSRYTSTHREKRHSTYDYSTSPPLSPDSDYSYSPYDYNHKHTRQERERFTANENTSQLISPMFHNRQSPSSTSRSSTSSPYSTSTALVPTSTRSPDSSPPATPVDSPSSPHSFVPPSRSPISKLDSKEADKNITVNGRAYELKGIRISTVVDEFKFVDCLEKNKQRLHLANIAYSQGLISSEEYSRKQREFLNAFSFF